MAFGQPVFDQRRPPPVDPMLQAEKLRQAAERRRNAAAQRQGQLAIRGQMGIAHIGRGGTLTGEQMTSLLSPPEAEEPLSDLPVRQTFAQRQDAGMARLNAARPPPQSLEEVRRQRLGTEQSMAATESRMARRAQVETPTATIGVKGEGTYTLPVRGPMSQEQTRQFSTMRTNAARGMNQAREDVRGMEFLRPTAPATTAVQAYPEARPDAETEGSAFSPWGRLNMQAHADQRQLPTRAYQPGPVEPTMEQIEGIQGEINQRGVMLPPREWSGTPEDRARINAAQTSPQYQNAQSVIALSKMGNPTITPDELAQAQNLIAEFKRDLPPRYENPATVNMDIGGVSLPVRNVYGGMDVAQRGQAERENNARALAGQMRQAGATPEQIDAAMQEKFGLQGQTAPPPETVQTPPAQQALPKRQGWYSQGLEPTARETELATASQENLRPRATPESPQGLSLGVAMTPGERIASQTATGEGEIRGLQAETMRRGLAAETEPGGAVDTRKLQAIDARYKPFVERQDFLNAGRVNVYSERDANEASAVADGLERALTSDPNKQLAARRIVESKWWSDVNQSLANVRGVYYQMEADKNYQAMLERIVKVISDALAGTQAEAPPVLPPRQRPGNFNQASALQAIERQPFGG